MKLGLRKKEKTEHLNFRVEVTLKQELIELFRECRDKGVDTTAAMNIGMREIAIALRRELDDISGANTGATSGAKIPIPNGADQRLA